MNATTRDEAQEETLGIPTASGYAQVDATPNPAELVRRLDRVGASGFWHALKQQTYQLLETRPGDRVLEVGCGAGDDALALSEMVGPSGRIVGVDLSHIMLLEARRRAASSYLPVDLVRADVGALPFSDGSFDACRVERVLQHLDHPAQALGELARVTRPGGRVVAVEPDYGTLSIEGTGDVTGAGTGEGTREGADREIIRRLLAVRRAHFLSPRIGRDLPGLCRGAGLTEVEVTLAPLITRTFDREVEAWLQRKYVFPAVLAGAISEEEAARLLEDLREVAARGRFHHVVFVHVVRARKP